MMSGDSLSFYELGTLFVVFHVISHIILLKAPCGLDFSGIPQDSIISKYLNYSLDLSTQRAQPVCACVCVCVCVVSSVFLCLFVLNHNAVLAPKMYE